MGCSTFHTDRRVSPVSANTYDDLVMDLQEAQAVKECRYAVFDANFNLADGSRRSKLVFFLWYVLSSV